MRIKTNLHLAPSVWGKQRDYRAGVVLFNLKNTIGSPFSKSALTETMTCSVASCLGSSEETT